DVVEVLVGQPRLLLAERRVGLHLRVRLERPEVVLQPGDERDVANRPFGGGRVEEVLEHAPVDLAVLRLGRAARPGREEDVRGRGPAHGGGDRLAVLQVGDERGDAAVGVLRPAAEPGHLPSVVEESSGEVSSTDARDADDERTPGLPDGHGLPVGGRSSVRVWRPLVFASRAAVVRRASGASRAGSAPRRPRTTQTARTVSVPSLMRRCGVDDGKVIESPGSRMKSSNPTTTRSVPVSTYPNSWPLWRTKESSGLDALPGA